MPKTAKTVDNNHNDGGIKKTRRRRRRSHAILKEIKRFQLSTDNLIPFESLNRLIREILQKTESIPNMQTFQRIQDPTNPHKSIDGSKYPGKDTINTMNIKRKAIKTLISAAESYLVTQFEASQLMALHAGRITVKEGDMINSNKVLSILKGEESIASVTHNNNLVDFNTVDLGRKKIILSTPKSKSVSEPIKKKKKDNIKKIIINKGIKEQKEFDANAYLKNMIPQKKNHKIEESSDSSDTRNEYTLESDSSDEDSDESSSSDTNEYDEDDSSSDDSSDYETSSEDSLLSKKAKK